MTNKRMRHLKKWIPASIYCDECRLWHNITDSFSPEKRCVICNKQYENIFKEANKKYEPCHYEPCHDDCEVCSNGMITYCAYLNHQEMGQYPLGDRCKICDIRDSYYTSKEYINHLQYEMKRYLEPDAYKRFLKYCKDKYVKKYSTL